MVTDVSEAMETLQGMVAEADQLAAAYRNPDIPAGTVLGETSLGSGTVQWTKPPSMVRAGKTALPKRFAAYDRDGALHMLPTAQLNRMLSKSRADAPGERAFHTHRADITRETCPICPPLKVPYPGSCEWCMESRHVKKVFANATAQRTHKLRYHPDELAANEAEVERAERREQIDAQKSVADAILASVQGGAAAAPATRARDLPVTEAVPVKPATVKLPGQPMSCDQCDWVTKPGTVNTAFARSGHVRAKHRGRN